MITLFNWVNCYPQLNCNDNHFIEKNYNQCQAHSSNSPGDIGHKL